MGFRYDAAVVAVEYKERGRAYEEKLVTVIMDLGQAGAGMWKNRYTFSIRAPKGELKEYEPVFEAIGRSTKINMEWLIGEVKGQLVRAGIMDKTLKEIQQISEEIASHREQTNAIIQNDMYLSLTGQEEFVNPYTKEIELGTNEWDHRWSSNGDFVIYTDDPNFDPNRIPELNHFEFRKSPVNRRRVTNR